MTLDTLTSWLAAGRVGLPYVRIDPIKIDVAAATAVVPYAYAARCKILLIAVNHDNLVIATSEPYVLGWMHDLARAWRASTSCACSPAHSTSAATSISGGLALRAEPALLVGRVRGEAATRHRALSRIKLLGRMDVAERRRPQDGRLKTRTPEGDEIELRLSTLPTAGGEKMVMRIFDPGVLLRSFEELGLSEHEVACWQGMVTQPHGILLVTGPTGSGKTTTLYFALRQLTRPEVNACTIEDPIEMVEPAFNPMQVQPQIQLDFASGVRALRRQDPDIIMIGEIRDRETAEMAIQAALTPATWCSRPCTPTTRPPRSCGCSSSAWWPSAWSAHALPALQAAGQSGGRGMAGAGRPLDPAQARKRLRLPRGAASSAATPVITAPPSASTRC